ncbi:MAG: gamma-glutamyl-gamma-aminobutyrate hydrolase family protein [Firmicutes bacterium]|nr:gamma-glutamyl-gamma-aminobutyrate hydrolase family protein [Bacillota bacterium]
MRPLIGITMNENIDYGTSLRRQYYLSLALAGANPVAMPVLDHTLAKDMLSSLDGLVLAGGADIAPNNYEEAALPGLGKTEVNRDEWELALAGEASKRIFAAFVGTIK